MKYLYLSALIISSSVYSVTNQTKYGNNSGASAPGTFNKSSKDRPAVPPTTNRGMGNRPAIMNNKNKTATVDPSFENNLDPDTNRIETIERATGVDADKVNTSVNPVPTEEDNSSGAIERKAVRKKQSQEEPVDYSTSPDHNQNVDTQVDDL